MIAPLKESSQPGTGLTYTVNRSVDPENGVQFVSFLAVAPAGIPGADVRLQAIYERLGDWAPLIITQLLSAEELRELLELRRQLSKRPPLTAENHLTAWQRFSLVLETLRSLTREEAGPLPRGDVRFALEHLEAALAAVGQP